MPNDSWKETLSAILDREEIRFNNIFVGIQGDNKIPGVNQKAKGELQTEFYFLRQSIDYWLQDLIGSKEKGKFLSNSYQKIEELDSAVESIASCFGEGTIFQYIPEIFKPVIKKRAVDVKDKVLTFNKCVYEFGKYVDAWDRLHNRDKDSELKQLLLRNIDAEAYVLLDTFHDKNVDYVDDEEVKMYTEKVKNGTYLLPGIIKILTYFTTRGIPMIPNKEDIFNGLVKITCAKTNEDWGNLKPKIEKGIKHLAEFFDKKEKYLNEAREAVCINKQRIVEVWAEDLKNYHLTALYNFTTNLDDRIKLMKKFG